MKKTKTARELYDWLPPGTALSNETTLMIVKCDDQWEQHAFNQDYVFNTATGRTQHISEFLPEGLTAEQFAQQWSIDPPMEDAERKLIKLIWQIISGSADQPHPPPDQA